MIDNKNGRKWARFWLVIALLVSTIANVTHAVLATSDISLWLRVPGAVVWPLFTFAGIEILVRMIWEKRTPHTATQWVLMSAAIPAAITSYEHQYTLLGMMGERWIIQCIGPIAIDGLMIGCTMALLFTRAIPAPPASEPTPDVDVDAVLAKWEIEDTAPVSPAPPERIVPMIHEPFDTAPKQRTPRAGSAEREDKVRAMLADPDLKPADSKDSTTRRYARVARALRDSPQATVDYAAEKVRADVVETIIRPWANLERVR